MQIPSKYTFWTMQFKYKITTDKRVPSEIYTYNEILEGYLFDGR
jgi:hypothetical protein